MARQQAGPKGGKTTRTPGGLVRKSVLLTEEISEELRERAHLERRSESEIVREALEEYFDRRPESGV
jgi:hypothetical protein